MSPMQYSVVVLCSLIDPSKPLQYFKGVVKKDLESWIIRGCSMGAYNSQHKIPLFLFIKLLLELLRVFSF